MNLAWELWNLCKLIIFHPTGGVGFHLQSKLPLRMWNLEPLLPLECWRSSPYLLELSGVPRWKRKLVLPELRGCATLHPPWVLP